MEGLPDELLGKIFERVPVEERRSLARVCRRFRRLAADLHYWRELRCGPALSCWDACRLMRKAGPFLRQLTVVGRVDANEILRCAVKYNRRLESLVVVTCKGHPGQKKPSLSADIVLRLLARCDKLRSLVCTGQALLGKRAVCAVARRLAASGDPLSSATLTCVNLRQVQMLSAAPGGVALPAVFR